MTKYITSGWETFSFIITPSELEAVLQDMHLLIVNRHVPQGYRETPLAVYIEDYSRIYSKLRAGKEVVSRDIWNFWEIGVAGALAQYPYGNLHTYCGEPYVSADFEEPCAIMKHFPLYFYTAKDGKTYLTIHASSIQFPEKTVGLALSFPKQVRYTAEGEDAPYRSTKDLTAYQDYLRIRDRVKAITNPLRLSNGEKEFRPRVRISPDALEHIDAFWFLQTNHVRAIK